MTTLNFSEQPVRRGQSIPLPTRVASGGDVTALETRVAALEKISGSRAKLKFMAAEPDIADG